MAETKKREPVLDLSTLVDRRTVRVDGVEYEMLNASELSIIDYHQISRKSDRCSEMMVRDELSLDEVGDLAAMLAWIVGRVLLAPPEVLARLNETHNLAVLTAFTNLQRGTTPAAGGGEAPSGETSTGAS